MQLIKVVAASALLLTASCRTMAVESTPAELRAVPMSQSIALEVAIEKIEAGDPAWVTADGNIRADAIMPILSADKAAWDSLDAFYNGAE